MSATVTKVRTRERQPETQRQSTRASVEGPAMSGIHPRLLSLQQSAGNRAVTNLLRAGSLVQRKCASCGSGSGNCADCEKEARVHRQAGNQEVQSEPSTTTEVVQQGLTSQTQSLEPTVRRSMESHFGQDFGHVRIHTDALAGQSARQVNARAYTVGSDIVFGSGNYQPYTREGQHLLAHELTHTIQQNNSVAYDRIGISNPTDASEREADAVAGAVVRGEPITQQPASAAIQVSRQTTTPTTTPATTPTTTPAASPGWTGCSTDQVKELPSELSDAVDWVNEAITDLGAKELPAHTKRALSRYLTDDVKKIPTDILPKLKLIQADLNKGATNFRCQTEAQCKAAFPNGANAYSGNPITLCPGYFNKSSRLDRVTTLIHESGHNAGLAGNVVEWQWPFPGLDEKTRLGNTESYAAFVRSNKYPSVAIFEHDIAPVLSTGALFPGGGLSPRYVVRVEFDAIVKRRVFHFMDLHAGYGIDVDSSGSILGSAYFGARSFAPLSLTQVPVFLDLRLGGVVGGIAEPGPQFRDLRGTGINVGGLSTDIGLGITSGRVGGSVSYRHIFNFLNKNPDINEVLVTGEIRF